MFAALGTSAPAVGQITSSSLINFRVQRMTEIMVRTTKALGVLSPGVATSARHPVTGTQLEPLDSIEPAQCPRGC